MPAPPALQRHQRKQSFAEVCGDKTSGTGRRPFSGAHDRARWICLFVCAGCLHQLPPLLVRQPRAGQELAHLRRHLLGQLPRGGGPRAGQPTKRGLRTIGRPPWARPSRPMGQTARSDRGKSSRLGFWLGPHCLGQRGQRFEPGLHGPSGEADGESAAGRRRAEGQQKKGAAGARPEPLIRQDKRSGYHRWRDSGAGMDARISRRYSSTHAAPPCVPANEISLPPTCRLRFSPLQLSFLYLRLT
jgi:hypothetical protein